MAGCPIDFVEFPAHDLARCISFYGRSFGWEYREQQPGYGHLGPPGDCASVGCGSAEFMFSPGQLAYITVDDIDGKLDEVAAAGGEVVRRRTKVSEEHGWYGLFKDPNGVLWGLWSQN